MNKLARCLLLVTTLVGLAGCGSWWLPPAHKINIQQGNLLDESAMNEIAEGMSMAEVESRLGTPIVSQTFRPERWDYIYSRNRSGEAPAGVRLTLHFSNGRIARIEKQQFGER